MFRLNFSHGAHEDHQARYDIIRELEELLGCDGDEVAAYLDLLRADRTAR